MDKRYQVFVSSTYQDLQEERREVMQALLELDCIPAGMELFPASSEDQWSLIKRVIDDCDYYLLIVGGRYGSTNESGVSYTEMEYDYAVSTGKPMICFLPKYPERIESGKTEQTEAGKKKLADFKEKVQHKMVKFYENPADLGAVVSRSVVKLIKNFPAEGWVKAHNAMDIEKLQKLADLQIENENLRNQMNEVNHRAPDGSELLAQGSDPIRIEFSIAEPWKDYQQDISEVYGNYSSTCLIEVTWNMLFAAVAPHLIGERSEHDMRCDIERSISDYIRLVGGEGDLDLSQMPSETGCSISEATFGKIKLQLKALGLIMLSKETHTGAHRVYWTLTPYGDYVMTQQFAIKKPAPNMNSVC